MRETFVWFFGPSCAGKETTLKAVAADQEHPLRSRLNLSAPLEVCGESLEVLNRPPLLEAIESRRREGLTQLIKGQRPDLNMDGAARVLWRAARGSSHMVVFVWTDPAVAERRCKERPVALQPWWQGTMVEQHEAELKEQVRLVRELEIGPVVCVRSDGEQVVGEPPWPSAFDGLVT